MGRMSTFRCRDCGREAQVCGGKDSGLQCQLRTVYCRSCYTLQDIVRMQWPPYQLELATRVPPSPCECCGATKYRVGNAGDACPRCGGEVEVIYDAGDVLWD